MALPQRPLNTWDVLKVVAIFLMFVDHAGVYVFTSDKNVYTLGAIGRGAAIIFLFLTGYARSYRFSWRLLGLATLLSGFDWIYFWHIEALNILFTLLFCRMIFNWFEVRGKVIKRPVEWYVCALPLFVVGMVCEYGSMGFIMALCGYMRRHKAHYSAVLRHGLSGVVFLTYASYHVYFAGQPINPFIAFGVMGAVMLWCMQFTLKDVRARWMPARITQCLQLISRYSGAIYVGHLLVLKVATGVVHS